MIESMYGELRSGQEAAILLFWVRVGLWDVRVDPPHTSTGLRHVHLRRKKIGGEYSWNVDGSRHDEHRFPVSEQSIKAAKQVAASALGVDPGMLRLLTPVPGGSLVTLRDGDVLPGRSARAPRIRINVPSDQTVFILEAGDAVAVVALLSPTAPQAKEPAAIAPQ